ncbi:hypothetical protein PV10_08346 [Exophiala mesophila]|uniref:Acyltransferase 3 domain-containing protein n=1 Tax=Exophiala mesophila TaxID=212818 RepID=A0A0D1Z1P1_EXOME|nr:uncharacterized protein PV10_08346 [Exophiala mesophila]KIV88687.1 hypothetical protein PV10_08346 [Exophiala mesophila]
MPQSTEAYQPLAVEVDDNEIHEKTIIYEETRELGEDSDDNDDDLDLKEFDLSQLPQECRPKWYQPARWRVAPNWGIRPKWNFSFNVEDIPDAKTLAWLLLSYFLAILPRYLQPGGLRVKKELHPTSYLDALRGWAALAVFRYHGLSNKTWLLEQPVIRTVLNGRAMVDIFFVISGYALSYRMLKMMRKRQPILLRALASSSFRRWWRLYASTGVASGVTAIMTYWGWCQPKFRKSTIWLQFCDWAWDWLASSNPFADIRGWWYGAVFRTKYLDQMWTIPVEFRGSLVLFWFCASSAYLTTRGRRLFCLIVISLCYYWGAIYAALFLWGMMIADLSFDRHPERLQKIQLPQQQQDGEAVVTEPRRQSVYAKVFWTMILLVAMFLCGQPPDGQWLVGPWPWPLLSKLIPWYYDVPLAEHFWLSWGATLLVFAIDNCRMLQIPLELGFSQYLGDLSFGIYAMHNTILWTLYFQVVEPWRAANLGDGYWSGLPGILFTTLVLLWCADYFTRLDNKVVAAGKWLESFFFVDWN